MSTLLQINTTLNYGSTGRIAENIGLLVKQKGWRSVMAHGPRMMNPSSLETIKTNSSFDEKIHGLFYSLLFDKHGLGSRKATQKFISVVKNDIRPDIIHLHNLHGYYINYEVLFKFLQSVNAPIIWTLHDCWPFTGHCANFDSIGCVKWRSECFSCPQYKQYPKSLFHDNSQSNYRLKRKLFTSISDRLTLVPVSYWLEGLIKQSFLADVKTKVIHNGIDLVAFNSSGEDGKRMKRTILGVASPWTKEKGFDDFIALRKSLPISEYDIVMIGLTREQIKHLPFGIIGIERTQDIMELVYYYSTAMALVNPTYQDNYPTTNLESIACGTPVITYDTGGSPEAITQDTGIVVEKGNIRDLIEAIKKIASWDLTVTAEKCRSYASENFDRNKCFSAYLDLYTSLTNQ